jgi:FlaA1/EpsC-like NDP-sugar epimerase
MNFPSGIFQRFRWLFVIGAELAAFIMAGITAFLLRFDFFIPANQSRPLRVAVAVWVVAKFVAFAALRLDRTSWRYVGVYDLQRLALANLAGSALGFLGIRLLAPAGFPRSVFLLDLVICLGLTAGMRVAVRMSMELWRQGHRGGSERKRALIYGAGAAGIALVREIHANLSLPYDVVGYVDDDPQMRGLSIGGARVLGDGAHLKEIVERLGVEMVLIAIPSAAGAEMVTILERCHAAEVECKTVPGMGELLEERGLAHQIRDVAVEDLLGRSTIHLEQEQIRAKLEGRIVLVTGAAGSIGSELCRQIARFRPAALVALDAAETPLFLIEREMERTFPDVPVLTEIGNIRDKERLADVFERHQPSVVYHAAAYKHVPMMEAHCFEAIENNVFGTLNVALAAIASGAEDFVMISTDKAVQPANVMGASKRIAELMIRSLQNGATKFVSVRFGNVLGSNGSVIPIFKEQIARGGPVTVTSPEMRRFFMTIPEASQLVLQASTMGEGGEIFVLDMGEPVRILDLARNLILLSGLRPDEDIQIEFMGARPGEKMYEELHNLTEGTLPTPHAKIKAFQGASVPWERMEHELKKLRELCAKRDFGQLVLVMRGLVADYNPSTDLLKRVLTPADDSGSAVAGSPPVTSRLPPRSFAAGRTQL